jgi:hypothetical protein
MKKVQIFLLSTMLFISSITGTAKAQDGANSFGNTIWMGMNYQKVSEKTANNTGLAGTKGVLITAISTDSPAEKATLRSGDVILMIGDTSVNDADHFRLILEKYRPEDQIRITYWRDKSEKETVLTFGKRASDMSPLGRLAMLASSEIRLQTGILLAGRYGANRSNLLKMYQSNQMDKLALEVMRLDYDIDQAYFYLGSAAQQMEFYDAARVYYSLALRTNYKCAPTNLCDGLDVSNASQNALKKMEGYVGWKSLPEYLSWKNTGFNPRQIMALKQQGIVTAATYTAAKNEFTNYKNRYPSGDEFSSVLKFISDQKQAQEQAISIDQLLSNREEAARLEAIRLEKAKQETDRIEAEKAAVAQKQKRKEEEAMVKALASLKVKSVGLGAVSVPCTPEEASYVDIMQKPVRLQYECSFGPRNDETQVIFAADRKTVVSVLRRQFLTPSDPEPSEVLQAAIRFYGPPVIQDDGNWAAMYGNPYNYNYTGKRIHFSRNDQGIGLLIDGKLCADGKYETAQCGNLGTKLIEYRLVNQPALLKSYEDGKARLAVQNTNKINNQKF